MFTLSFEHHDLLSMSGDMRKQFLRATGWRTLWRVGRRGAALTRSPISIDALFVARSSSPVRQCQHASRASVRSSRLAERRFP